MPRAATTYKTFLMATATLVAGGSGALAQSFPDMIGVWTGQAEGVIIGNPMHFSADGSDGEAPRIAAFELTIDISHQDGRFIWGTISGGNSVEPWLATLWSDGSGYSGVDSDGFMNGRILAETTVENCYAHTGNTMVAACVIMERQ